MKKLLTLLYKFVTLCVYKVKGVLVARPRVIKLDDGEIKLIGFSKEKADDLVNLLSGVSSTDRGPIETKETVEPVVDEELTETAFSVRLGENKKWQLVTIKYNGSTKDAVVESLKDTEAKSVALGEMKMELFKNGTI